MKYIVTLLILGQILMAATIEYIETNSSKVPVVYESDTRLPLVTMQFTFTNSGSVTDLKKAGLARFSAKVMSEGTKTLGSAAFAEALEAKAIHISASSGGETFVIEMSCLKEEFDEALQYFDSLIKEPNLSDETLNKVKTMTLGSLSSKENDFDYVASNELKAILFKGTVLGQPSLGTGESVKSIELSDVEEFVKSNLVSKKLIVVIGGDVDFESAKAKIAKVIEAMPEGNSSQTVNYSVTKEPKENILKKETEQAYIYFGSPYNIEENSPEYYKARVATFILGTGGFGSRLMEEIRVKRGLAYSAYAKIDVSKSSSYFNGYLQTKLDALEVAKKTVNEVIADFVKNGVTKDELEQTKKFLLGSEPLRVETMSQRLNRTFMEFYKGQELGYSQKELDMIKSLKLEDLNTFIKSHTEINNLSYAIVTK
ncbi:MAG: pitrilysin family protein [Campylobacterales bacterium]|nr:pitrilysin family protein [Campylobacterales bacterium]